MNGTKVGTYHCDAEFWDSGSKDELSVAISVEIERLKTGVFHYTAQISGGQPGVMTTPGTLKFPASNPTEARGVFRIGARDGVYKLEIIEGGDMRATLVLSDGQTNTLVVSRGDDPSQPAALFTRGQWGVLFELPD